MVKKYYLITFVFVLILIFIGYASASKLRNKSFLDDVKKENPLVFGKDPSPTPFPFQELTIPYLRARQYKSELGALSKYSEDHDFNSYLTHYSSDGLKINGLLTIPKEEMPKGGFPAIVFVHGYIAPSIYKTTERYQDYVNYLASSGFVVFKIDLRGHGESEGEASGAYYSSDYIVDTLNAYSALQNSDFVNPGKIGLWGHSMAGNVTLRSFVAKPDIPAVVIWAGAGYTYQDLQDYRINDNSYRPPAANSQRQKSRQKLRETYGEFNSENEFWKQVSPINYLSDLKGAIELNHAVNDNVVSVEYSRNLNKLLNETLVVHEFNEYPSGGHNISGNYFSVAMEKTVNFYNKYLK